MARPIKTSAVDYSSQFKPAVQLGAPTLAQWAGSFYAVQLQEKVDPSGDHFLRLGRGLSSDPTMSTVIQLQTTVPGFTPNYRQVEVAGKKGYTALCLEGGANKLGVFVCLIRSAEVGGSASEVHINSRYLPYSMLTDLVIGTTKTGLLELRLPDSGLAKLNVTLRLSALQEPEFRTFKTEVLFENLPAAIQQEVENRLNFEAASISAFLGYQILGAQGQMSAPSALGAASAVELSPVVKTLAVAILTTAGAVCLIINRGVDVRGLADAGTGLAGAGAVLGAWLRFADAVGQARVAPDEAEPPV